MKLYFSLHAGFLNFSKLQKTTGFCCFLVICFIFPHITHAQNANSALDIKWSKNQKAKAIYYENMEILKGDENKIYFFNSFKNGKPMAVIPSIYETLGKYDSQSDSISYLTLKLKTENVNRTRLSVMIIDSTIHVVSYFNNKKQDAVYIFDETINMKTFIFNDDIHKIAEIKYDRSLIKNSNNIFITLKKDLYAGKNLLQLNYVYSTKGGTMNGYELLDNKFSPLANFQSTITDNKDVTNYVFDKDYNLYTLERTYQNSLFTNFIKSSLSLTFHPKDGSSVVKQDVLLENKFITAQTLAVNDKNQIICGGLFSNIGLTNALGAFTTIYPPKLQDVGSMHKVDFDYDFLSKGMNEKDAEVLKKNLEKNKDSDDSYSCSFRNMHFRKDGCFDFVVEKKLKEYVSDGYGKGGHHVFRYSDLYVLDFNADGSSKWIRKIYRNEAFSESMFYTHFLGDCLMDNEANDEINIIHNRFNMENKEVYDESSLKNGKTYVTSFDSNGNMTEKALTSDPDISKNLCPGMSYSCGNNTYCLAKMNYLSTSSFLKAFKSSIYSVNLGIVTIK